MKNSYLFKNQIYFASASDTASNQNDNTKEKKWHQSFSKAKWGMILGGSLMAAGMFFPPLAGVGGAIFVVSAGAKIVEKAWDFAKSTWNKLFGKDDESKEAKNAKIDLNEIKKIKEEMKKLKEEISDLKKENDKLKNKDSLKPKKEDRAHKDSPETRQERNQRIINEKFNSITEGISNLSVTKDGKEALKMSMKDFGKAIALDIQNSIDNSFGDKDMRDKLKNLQNAYKKAFPGEQVPQIGDLKNEVINNIKKALFEESPTYFTESQKEQILGKDGSVNDKFSHQYKVDTKGNIIEKSLNERIQNFDKLNPDQQNKLQNDIEKKKNEIYENSKMDNLIKDKFYNQGHYDRLNENRKPGNKSDELATELEGAIKNFKEGFSKSSSKNPNPENIKITKIDNSPSR